MNRVQLNRWVLETTAEYLTQLAKLRGFKRGAMLDRLVEEYRNPPITYLMEQLLQKLPEETYFTEAEKKQIKQLKEMLETYETKNNP